MYFNFIQANFHVSILSNLVTFTPYNSCLLDVHHALPSVHSQMHEISTFDHMDSKCKSRHAKNQSRGANFTNCWDLRDHTMNLTLNLIASWPTYANFFNVTLGLDQGESSTRCNPSIREVSWLSILEHKPKQQGKKKAKWCLQVFVFFQLL